MALRGGKRGKKRAGVSWVMYAKSASLGAISGQRAGCRLLEGRKMGFRDSKGLARWSGRARVSGAGLVWVMGGGPVYQMEGGRALVKDRGQA